MNRAEQHRQSVITELRHEGNRISGHIENTLTILGTALEKPGTAQVFLPHNDSNLDSVRLGICSDFFDQHDMNQRIGVLFHEVCHVVYRHLENFTTEPYASNRQRAIVAEEIHCNDTVLNHGYTLPDVPYTGEKILGFNTFGMTLRQIFDSLPEDMGNDGESDNKGESGEGNGSEGNGSEGNGSEGNGDCGICQNGDTPSAEDIEAIRKIAEEIVNSPNFDPSMYSGKTAGKGSLEEQEARQTGTSIEWVQFLLKMCPEYSQRFGGRSRVRYDWSRRPRRLSGTRNIVLPVRADTKIVSDNEGRKKKIIVIVDQSGSIGEQERETALRLTAAVPADIFDTKAYAFADGFCEIVKKKDEASYVGNIGGGTSMTAVNDAVIDADYKRGDKVLLLTDGAIYNDDHRTVMHASDLFVVAVGSDATETTNYSQSSGIEVLSDSVEMHPVVDAGDFTSSLV